MAILIIQFSPVSGGSDSQVGSSTEDTVGVRVYGKGGSSVGGPLGGKGGSFGVRGLRGGRYLRKSKMDGSRCTPHPDMVNCAVGNTWSGERSGKGGRSRGGKI